MSRALLFGLGDEPRSLVLGYAAESTCVLAAVAVVLSLVGWLVPALLNAIADWAMIIGFIFAFFGMAAAIICSWVSDLGFGGAPGRRFKLRRSPSLGAVLSRAPRRLKLVMGTIIALGVVSFALSFFGTGDYSQNPSGTLPRCKWSIGTNHGLTNICVSHARWLATGEEFQRAFIGLIAVFLSIECLIFAAVSRRDARPG
jgi:hypothetical protein